jgi:hypothetical protein
MTGLSLRERVVGGGDSWSSRRRAERLAWFLKAFPRLAEMTVLDLGGDPSTWLSGPVHPRHVDIVNIETLEQPGADWIRVEAGDACALPPHIASRTYDLVFSNSVLEHVGGHERRMRFAESVHTMAPAHWVQTPYRYFPVEPHWVAPGMQYLPVRARAAFARRWPLAHVKSANLRDALDGVLWTELVDRTQMRYYFPDSRIISERILGLTKSLIAVRPAA